MREERRTNLVKQEVFKHLPLLALPNILPECSMIRSKPTKKQTQQDKQGSETYEPTGTNKEIGNPVENRDT